VTSPPVIRRLEIVLTAGVARGSVPRSLVVGLFENILGWVVVVVVFVVLSLITGRVTARILGGGL
jgi:hypothetical protein